MAPTASEKIGENNAFADPKAEESRSPTPWLIVAVTVASFLAVTFVGFLVVCLVRKRRLRRQRVGAAATAAMKQHNHKYYSYHGPHQREGSFERSWPSPTKNHHGQIQPGAAAERQRSYQITKSRASRESWSSYGGGSIVADDTPYPYPQQQKQNFISQTHAYTAVSGLDDDHNNNNNTSTSGGVATRRNHHERQQRYGHGYDNSDSDSDSDSGQEEYEQQQQQQPAARRKKPSSSSLPPSSDWKEREVQGGRLSSSSLQDPATLGRGHPAFSPELQQVQLPARLPRTLAPATDYYAGRRASP